MIYIGFTGTQRGMTILQQRVVKELLPREFVAIHGDCVGADADFHDIVRFDHPTARFIIYPSDLLNKRAHCTLWPGDICRPSRPALVRNKDIVGSSDWMIACPGEKQMKIRSGTWSTMRYAQKEDMRVVIVFPDGSKAEA